MTTETKHMPSEREIEAAATKIADMCADGKFAPRDIAIAAFTAADQTRAVVDCTTCGGDGYDKNSLNDPGPCPSCNGTGVDDAPPKMLAASPPAPASQVLTEEELKKIVRAELIDKQSCYETASSWTKDVLLAGCKAVGYGVPTTPEQAADAFAGFVARAIFDRITNKDAEHG